MSHIKLDEYIAQTLPVINASETPDKSLELYATRLLNELKSRHVATHDALNLVREYKSQMQQLQSSIAKER